MAESLIDQGHFVDADGKQGAFDILALAVPQGVIDGFAQLVPVVLTGQGVVIGEKVEPAGVFLPVGQRPQHAAQRKQFSSRGYFSRPLVLEPAMFAAGAPHTVFEFIAFRTAIDQLQGLLAKGHVFGTDQGFEPVAHGDRVWR